MLYGIVWNKTVFDIETVSLCKTELYKIELFRHLTELFLLFLIKIYAYSTSEI